MLLCYKCLWYYSWLLVFILYVRCWVPGFSKTWKLFKFLASFSMSCFLVNFPKYCKVLWFDVSAIFSYSNLNHSCTEENLVFLLVRSVHFLMIDSWKYFSESILKWCNEVLGVFSLWKFILLIKTVKVLIFVTVNKLRSEVSGI